MLVIALLAEIVIIIVTMSVCIPPKCDHKEIGKMYSFQFENSTADHYVKPYCLNCGETFKSTSFRGTPVDNSFREAIAEHSDSIEIVGGEYYTVTAIVTLGDYDIHKTRINCKVQNETTIVAFSVEFGEGFEEAVALLEKGQEITFRGRFSDNGCSFTDCELIE